jgi:hypothetical protein
MSSLSVHLPFSLLIILLLSHCQKKDDTPPPPKVAQDLASIENAGQTKKITIAEGKVTDF